MPCGLEKRDAMGWALLNLQRICKGSGEERAKRAGIVPPTRKSFSCLVPSQVPSKVEASTKSCFSFLSAS